MENSDTFMGLMRDGFTFGDNGLLLCLLGVILLIRGQILTRRRLKKGFNSYKEAVDVFMNGFTPPSWWGGHAALFTGSLFFLWGFLNYSMYDEYILYGLLAVAGTGFFYISSGVRRAKRRKQLLMEYRIKDHHCPSCSAVMRKLSLTESERYADSQAVSEMRQNAMEYDLYQCPSCSTMIFEPFRGTSYSSYSECKHCHARTYKMTGDKVLKAATVSHSGLGRKEYTCFHCNAVDSVEYTIPRKSTSSSSSSSGSSGSRSYSGGGGRSGGGGASAKW